MTEHVDLLVSVLVDDMDTTEVAPGIVRRALPGGARVFDFLPGSVWPETDHHTSDENIYVASGELIDGGRRYPAGSYLHYRPGSSHRPGTESGARILVFGP
ncbi:cupin domain-containing protein [Plantactinospora sp. WMMB782]|uniref:cupin domain-containing protein n=1 Tax=Plantactinospora sp. WMMB782 TaxID=3404121 RepID=UPI003B93CBAD